MSNLVHLEAIASLGITNTSSILHSAWRGNKSTNLIFWRFRDRRSSPRSRLHARIIGDYHPSSDEHSVGRGALPPTPNTSIRPLLGRISIHITFCPRTFQNITFKAARLRFPNPTSHVFLYNLSHSALSLSLFQFVRSLFTTPCTISPLLFVLALSFEVVNLRIPLRDMTFALGPSLTPPHLTSFTIRWRSTIERVL